MNIGVKVKKFCLLTISAIKKYLYSKNKYRYAKDITAILLLNKD